MDRIGASAREQWTDEVGKPLFDLDLIKEMDPKGVYPDYEHDHGQHHDEAFGLAHATRIAPARSPKPRPGQLATSNFAEFLFYALG